MTDQPLNAQQLQQIQANAEKQVLQIIERLKLRQWAVEQALSHNSSPDTVVDVAGKIYDFIIQPANVKIELG